MSDVNINTTQFNLTLFKLQLQEFVNYRYNNDTLVKPGGCLTPIKTNEYYVLK